ncbi:glycosyltransferase [Streptomyces sp. NBC_00435]|uniref:glycosyltransferase family 2 protein n=1 Tax=Streptomyces sp. NBC_00435 TaxID=2903649 RepID=UPI002E1AEB47
MTPPRDPRVSVICPTFNRSRAITDTLDSVSAQSVTDWELLVVSDGSTDDTDDWVRDRARSDPRIRLIRTERHGHPSGPRNRGLAEARGAYTVYLDHDDLWFPGHLRVLLEAFADGAGFVATGFEVSDRHGTVTSASRPLEMCWHPEIQTLGPVFEPSRVAHRSGLAEQVGGWRAGGGAEDWDLWLRLADAGTRFATVLDRTVRLLSDAGTRRHGISLRRRMSVAVFDDARRAHAALRELRDDRHGAALRAACTADTRAWLRRMAASAQFVRPAGWAGDPEAGLTDGPEALGGSWTDLVLVPDRGRYLLALPLACVTAEHALRVQSLVRRTQPSQFALIDEVTARHGGTLPAPGVAGAVADRSGGGRS